MTIAWAGLILFASLVIVTDQTIRHNARNRTAEAQVKRLQEEARRDRSKDWERHRGGN